MTRIFLFIVGGATSVNNQFWKLWWHLCIKKKIKIIIAKCIMHITFKKEFVSILGQTTWVSLDPYLSKKEINIGLLRFYLYLLPQLKRTKMLSLILVEKYFVNAVRALEMSVRIAVR
jgi:hypothetical protein